MLVVAVLVVVLGVALVIAGSVVGYVSGGALIIAGALMYRNEHRRRQALAVAAPVATGSTPAARATAIPDAVAFHLDGMREDGAPMPPSSSRVTYVAVAA